MGYEGVAVKIPFGNMGIVTDMAPADLPPSSFIRAENITLENGLVEKARGGLRYNTNALAAGIIAAVDYWPDVLVQRTIAVCSNGSVYRDIGDRLFSGGTAIASGLGTLTPNTQLIIAGAETSGAAKKLFLLTEGLNQLKVLSGDGTSFANVSTPAADWVTPNFPKVAVVFRNRLWVFMQHTAYASNSGNHEVFTTNALIQPIYIGEGGEVIGAFVYKGRLFAFKDGGHVYYLNDENESDTYWYWQKLAGNFGLASPHGVLDALDDMIAINTTGTATSYSAVQSLGDVESADIFRNAKMERFVHANLNKGGLRSIHTLYYSEKKQVFMTYRSGSNSTNNTMICIDINDQAPKMMTLPKGTPNCLFLRRDVYGIDRPAYGDNSGYIILMDQEDRLEATAAYTATFQTPALDFRFADPTLGSVEKHFDHLTVEFVPQGNWNLSCDYFIDGKLIETLTFPMYVDPDYTDEFELDEDYLPAEHTNQVTKRLKGTGRNISFKFYQAGSNQSFQVAGISVGFRPGANRQLRRTS